MSRDAFYEEHGVGLPVEVDIADLDPAEIGQWSDDQLRRAEASGLLASLADHQWPESALNGETDGTDGMCKFRKLYLRRRPRKEVMDENEYLDWEENGE